LAGDVLNCEDDRKVIVGRAGVGLCIWLGSPNSILVRLA
jgi:hypothetical protein